MHPASLENIRFFAKMKPEERAELAPFFRRESFAKGDSIIVSAQLPSGLYLVDSGGVQISIHLPGDVRSSAWVAKPGDVFNVLSVVVRTFAPISATALEPTEVRILDASVVDGLRKQSSPLAFGVLMATARISCAQVRYVLTHLVNDTLAPSAPAPEVSTEPLDPTAPLTELHWPLLRVIPLFHGVSPGQVSQGAAFLTKRTVRRGQRLFEEGDSSSTLHIVLRGAVETSVRRDGRRRRLTLCGPGHLVGEIAFMDGKPQPADAVARESSIILQLERDTFDRMVDARAALALMVLEAIATEQSATLGGAGRRGRARAEGADQASSSTVEIDGRSPAGSA